MNVLKGKVEQAKLVTDPVVVKLARSLELNVLKGDITFEADYDKLHNLFASDSHPYSKLYGINKGERQGAAIQVISGLPMTRPTDGELIIPKFRRNFDNFLVDRNLFTAEVINSGHINVHPIVDQPNGVTKEDFVSWNPVLILDGNIVSPKSGPVLLPVDPINSDLKHNTIEWDYRICKRRLRVIQGRFRERWVFFSNPNGTIRLIHNHKGKADFRLGRWAVDIDVEEVRKEVFDSVEYPFEISASLTFYPDVHEEEYSVDGWCEETTDPQTWAGIRGGGDLSDDNAANWWIFRFLSSATEDMWKSLMRAHYLFYSASLPDTCVIDSGIMSIYGTNKADTLGDLPNAALVDTSPASDTELVGGDYIEFGAVEKATARIAYAAWNEAGYNDFTLNAGGLANISKTGVTKFGVLNGNFDLDMTPPTWGNSGAIAGNYADNGTNKPKLLVVYSIPPKQPMSLRRRQRFIHPGNRNIL